MQNIYIKVNTHFKASMLVEITTDEREAAARYWEKENCFSIRCVLPKMSIRLRACTSVSNNALLDWGQKAHGKKEKINVPSCSIGKIHARFWNSKTHSCKYSHYWLISIRSLPAQDILPAYFILLFDQMYIISRCKSNGSMGPSRCNKSTPLFSTDSHELTLQHQKKTYWISSIFNPMWFSHADETKLIHMKITELCWEAFGYIQPLL